jgi:hypothetical protein
MQPGELIRHDNDEPDNIADSEYYILLHPDNEHGAFVPAKSDEGVGRHAVLGGVTLEDANDYETGDPETRRDVVERYVKAVENLPGGFKVLKGSVNLRWDQYSSLNGGRICNWMSQGNDFIELSPPQSDI